jgi:hypothetical protein
MKSAFSRDRIGSKGTVIVKIAGHPININGLGIPENTAGHYGPGLFRRILIITGFQGIDANAHNTDTEKDDSRQAHGYSSLV